MKRPKALKQLSAQRIFDTREIIIAFSQIVQLLAPIHIISRDPKDDYLLAFSGQCNIDYLVTGDKDLLILKTYQQTNIVTFSEFMELL